MQPELIRLRSRVVTLIRTFFDERGFLEIHTPRLVGLPGQEPHLDPMWTCVSDVKSFSAALITSPEYAMKKMLAAGFDKIYDLGPCFRDHEPWDGSHDPEFLMLEWYRRDAGLEELMRDSEEMIRHVFAHVPLLTKERLGEVPSDSSFRRLTVRDVMQQYAHVDLDSLLENREALANVVREHHQTVTDTDTWDDLFFKIFLTEVELHLGWSEDHTSWLPTFLYQYPACMAALARRDSSDSRYALRTELYIGDLELANGFAELCDPVEQRKRFKEEQALRRALGKKIWPIDETFIAALPKMGNAAGIAFGVDRLAMLIAGTHSISDLMPIPVQERFAPETSV